MRATQIYRSANSAATYVPFHDDDYYYTQSKVQVGSHSQVSVRLLSLSQKEENLEENLKSNPSATYTTNLTVEI